MAPEVTIPAPAVETLYPRRGPGASPGQRGSALERQGGDGALASLSSEPAAAVELGAAFGMPPRDAVAYFESKGYQLTFDWKDMWQEAHARAFTVTSVAKLDVLKDIRGALDTALKEGKTEKWFTRQLEPVLREKGWWGTRIDVDEHGNAKKVRMGSPSRLALIFRQNMQTAYNAGRYRQQLANAVNAPIWVLLAVLDEKTREAHAAYHETAYEATDPIWLVLYPPNGWGCRCRVVAMGRKAAERAGYTVQTGELVWKEVETVNRDTGEVEQRKVGGLRFAKGGEKYTVYTGTGFSYNPGAASFGTDMELARKLSLIKDPKLYAEVVQAINNEPLRHADFAAKAGKVIESRRAGNDALAVGLVEKDIADYVRGKGYEPATILVMPERTLLHATREHHKKAGISPTDAEIKSLPLMVARPEMVLWDIEHQSVVYVYPYGDPARRIIISARMPARSKERRYVGDLDAVVNAYKTPVENLFDRARYEQIK